MTTKAKIWTLSACMAAVLFCSLGTTAHAQVDPTGTLWDLQITGYAVVGSGYMEFFGDHTLSGYMIIRPNPGLKPALRPADLNIGFFFVSGEWNVGLRNKVVGFFNGGSTGVPLDITSFSATVIGPPRSRISMIAMSNDGKMAFVGSPAISLPDLTDSSWTANVLKNLVRSTEFFGLTPFFLCNDNPADPFD